MIASGFALERLRAGNVRFVAGSPAHEDRRPATLRDGQQPFAIVLGCSDSRVPPELVFDQTLGQLFVVRAAGHVAGPAQIGSIEFAAHELGARLVVVLGHARCGAVAAAVASYGWNAGALSSDLEALLDEVRSAIGPVVEASAGVDVVAQAVRANILSTVQRLHASPVLAELVQNEGLAIVGAEYDLDTGDVTFLDRAVVRQGKFILPLRC